jgi:hypothetical protein
MNTRLFIAAFFSLPIGILQAVSVAPPLLSPGARFDRRMLASSDHQPASWPERVRSARWRSDHESFEGCC